MAVSSVHFSCSVMSNSLQRHGLQLVRPPCQSPTPGVDSDSCSLSQWSHPTILSSVVPFSSRLQSFPASGSFQMSQFFPSGGQSVGVSVSASVLPMNTQDWSPLGLTGWISLQSKGQLTDFSNTTVQKHQFFGAQLSLYPTSTGSLKKQENSRQTSTSALLTMPKSLTVWITTNCGKFKRWKYQTTWPASWEICMQVGKQQLELDMEQQTASKSEEYVKAVYCHPAYLTYMQSTSWEMLGWMKRKLKSRFLGETLITSDMQMTPPIWQKAKKN